MVCRRRQNRKKAVCWFWPPIPPTTGNLKRLISMVGWLVGLVQGRPFFEMRPNPTCITIAIFSQWSMISHRIVQQLCRITFLRILNIWRSQSRNWPDLFKYNRSHFQTEKNWCWFTKISNTPPPPQFLKLKWWLIYRILTLQILIEWKCMCSTSLEKVIRNEVHIHTEQVPHSRRTRLKSDKLLTQWISTCCQSHRYLRWGSWPVIAHVTRKGWLLIYGFLIHVFQ